MLCVELNTVDSQMFYFTYFLNTELYFCFTSFAFVLKFFPITLQKNARKLVSFRICFCSLRSILDPLHCSSFVFSV